MPDRPGGVGSRREARERALVLLYEAETKQLDGSEVLAAQPIEIEGYAADLVLGVSDALPELDALLGKHARGWEVSRMPVIDRTLLRMASFELRHRPDVPPNAVINEAVVLAKQYSTEDSGRFVNGVLAAIAADTDTDSDAGRGTGEP